MKRSEGERVRLKHVLERMRTTLSNVELALALPGPIGLEAAGAVTTTATEIATTIARCDAYLLAEEDKERE